MIFLFHCMVVLMQSNKEFVIILMLLNCSAPSHLPASFEYCWMHNTVGSYSENIYSNI